MILTSIPKELKKNFGSYMVTFTLTWLNLKNIQEVLEEYMGFFIVIIGCGRIHLKFGSLGTTSLGVLSDFTIG